MALGMYLELDGINGSVNHPDLEGSINIVDWTFRVDAPRDDAAGTGEGIDLVLHADASAPHLFVACMAGRIVDRGRIVVRSGNGTVLFEVRLEGILVSSMGATAHHDDNQPTTHVNLKCQRVAGLYTARGADGTAGETTLGGWDLMAGREWTPTVAPPETRSDT